MKEYKIAYRNWFNSFFSYSISAVFNLMFFEIIAIILCVLVLYVTNELKVFVICSIILCSLSAIVSFTLSFRAKKVIINDLAILVKRNSIFVLTDWFNDCVLFSEIESCDLYIDERIKWPPDTKKYAVRFFDWDCAVQIIDNKNNEYIIPVENAEDFIDDVTERVNKYRRENGLEEI